MKSTLLFFLLAISTVSCVKTDAPSTPTAVLPDTSSSGRNILAYKIGEQIHAYAGKGHLGNDQGVSYIPYQNDLYIGANKRVVKNRISFHLGEDSLKANYLYELSASDGKYAQYEDFEIKENPEYRTDYASGWILFSRIDDKVAAGTFAFTAYYNGSAIGLPKPDTVRITDGRFDIAR